MQLRSAEQRNIDQLLFSCKMCVAIASSRTNKYTRKISLFVLTYFLLEHMREYHHAGTASPPLCVAAPPAPVHDSAIICVRKPRAPDAILLQAQMTTSTCVCGCHRTALNARARARARSDGKRRTSAIITPYIELASICWWHLVCVQYKLNGVFGCV